MYIIWYSKQYPDNVVTNVLLDWINDQCYSLHANANTLFFTFVVVIVNPIIFD